MSKAPPTPTQTPTTILLLELNPDEGCGLDVVDDEGVELDWVTTEVWVTITVFPLSTEANVVKRVELLEGVSVGEVEVVGVDAGCVEEVDVSWLAVIVVVVAEGNVKLEGETRALELNVKALLDVEADRLDENRGEDELKKDGVEDDSVENRAAFELKLAMLSEFPSARATNCTSDDAVSVFMLSCSPSARTSRGNVAKDCKRTRDKRADEAETRLGPIILIERAFDE